MTNKDKKELTQEELEKIAGGQRRPTGSSNSSSSSYTPPFRRPRPVQHRTSSSTVP